MLSWLSKPAGHSRPRRPSSGALRHRDSGGPKSIRAMRGWQWPRKCRRRCGSVPPDRCAIHHNDRYAAGWPPSGSAEIGGGTMNELGINRFPGPRRATAGDRFRYEDSVCLTGTASARPRRRSCIHLGCERAGTKRRYGHADRLGAIAGGGTLSVSSRTEYCARIFRKVSQGAAPAQRVCLRGTDLSPRSLVALSARGL